MLSLIEQIKTGALWNFPGGVHPAENKTQSVNNALERATIAQEIVLPVKQHIGKPGTITVEVGEQVLKGQSLTKYDTSFMLPVHAPTSGTVVAIEPRTTAHPSGLSETCIIIQPDMADSWIEREAWSNYSERTPDELIEKIRQAGVSGMGGAGFPTAKKIQSGLARTEILIINAAECEPYITADDMLMREHAEEIIQGIEIVEHILKPKLTVIGIEDNKPEAVKALQQAAQHKDIVIRVIPTKYPSGGEKQLIKILTNKEVPNGGIPADIGMLVQNVGSLYAIKRAVCDGEPLVERIVTLTGDTFKQPRNVWALLGTPVEALLDEFSYKADKKLPRLIMGGPMMGFTLPHAQVPITKTSNCILAPTRKEISPNQYEMACIRCGQCAEACPASLLPQQLVWHAKAEELDKCEELNIQDCIECGACAFVCPSEIPLVQYYRQAKAEIRTRKEEAEAAERAKIRFEEKKARLERDKAARENRFKKAADDRRKEMKSTGGDDAIAAAIARVKAQKSDSAAEEKAVKPAVAAAIAKAKAKQAAAMQSGQAEPDNSEMMKLREERKRQARERKAEKAQQPENASAENKKEAVAAAVARAKARKAEQSDSDNAQAPAVDKKAAVAAAIARAKAKKARTEESDQAPPTEDKKVAVAAAIARAKARKAEQQAQSESAEKAPKSEPTEQDPKKAAVAAAIARAKARKAEQQAQSESAEEAPISEQTGEDPKKAAVAAAIARAKARKAEQQAQSESAEEAPKSESTEEDPKKAAVAAAIARAKARKAEQQAQSESAESEPTEEDPKKAAVAAAIARAKARKAEQQAQSESAEEAPISEHTDEDPKKAAVAAAIARAKARKAEKEQQKQFEEKE